MTVTASRPVAPAPARARVWPRVVAGVLLLGYGLLLVIATLDPDPATAGTTGTPIEAGSSTVLERVFAALHGLGVPSWFGFTELEILANVAVFVPIGLLAALALPRRLWWAAFLAACALSAAIELIQLLALPTRVASLSDVAANSAGALLGVALAALLRALVPRRP